MKEIFEKIQSLSERDVADAKGLTLKAMEELGELVQALLHEDGYKPNNKSLEEIRENQKEEACDVIICIFGVLDKLGFGWEETKNMMHFKTDKWERVLNERKLKK